MTIPRDSFEALAERGDPLGATRLLDRVRDELETRPMPRRRRRRSGPVVAVASFLMVLALGAALVALAPWGEGPAQPDGIRFEQLPDGIHRPAPIPGGFFAVDGDKGLPVVSSDLREWRPVQLPEVFPGAVVATADAWFLVEAGQGSMWVIRGDQVVAEIAVPSALAERLATLHADSATVLAQVEDPFAELPATLWRLDESLEWEALRPVGLPDDGRFEIAGREDRPGFVAVAVGDDGFVSWVSAAGESWAAGEEVAVPGAVGASRVDVRVVSGGHGWIVVASVRGESGATEVHLYTSVDGISWTEQAAPPWDAEFPLVAEAGDRVIAATRDEVWVTADGAVWELAHRFPSPVWIEAATVVEGRPVVLWSPVQSDPESPTTTVVFPQVDPDPAGVALQDQILADGRVTRAEFESAVGGMVECMRDRGLDVTEWQVDPDGSFGFSFRGPDRPGVDLFCQDSYLGRISEQMDGR